MSIPIYDSISRLFATAIGGVGSWGPAAVVAVSFSVSLSLSLMMRIAPQLMELVVTLVKAFL